MKVERVYTRGAIAVSMDASLDVAAAVMRRHHVGSLLVGEGPQGTGEIVGVITDRDIVIQCVADGYDPRTLTVAQVMTPQVAVVREETDLHEALELMHGSGLRRLAVANGDERIVGVLSLDDVLDGIAVDMASLAGTVKRGIQREANAFDPILPH
ncbi:MAG TPA: CBS domain-containing protein [Usitatibacteraceae bacterium]|jgi:CBS domain-containing protein|nr:CBS domain-containing protein [Usitatibacteraceae bacterium]